MFLLLLALLIGLVLGQFIKIQLPSESKQVLIPAIKAIPGLSKAMFDRLLQELGQQRQSINLLSQSIDLQSESFNGKQPNSALIETAIEKQ